MITEQDLVEAIEHYENLENPTAQTCITLAAFYEVREHLYPVDTGQSYDAPPIYRSDTKFGQMVGSRDPGMVYGLIDELLDTIKILNLPLYNSVMQKIEDM